MKKILLTLSTLLSIHCVADDVIPTTAYETLATLPVEGVQEVVEKHLQLDTVQFNALKTAGFTPLIGDTLDGWKIHNDKPEATYTLKDGVISGVSKKLKGNSWLYTTEQYADFLLYFEFKFDDLSGNSGVMYRSHYRGNAFAGLQYEMDNAVKKSDGMVRQWTGLLYAENAGGWYYPNRDRKIDDLDKASIEWKNQLSTEGHDALDETGWNAAFIRVRGKEIQTWLNKQIRVNYNASGQNFPTDEGMIALQLHGGRSCAASWRNMYIKPLKSDSSTDSQ